MITLNYRPDNVIVKAEDVILRGMANHLSFPDPRDEYMSQKQGRPPRWIKMMTYNKLPAGLLTKALHWCKEMGHEVRVEDTTKAIEPTPTDLPQWLYPHQPRAIAAAIESKRGIISSPTGSGKTTIAGFFIKHFPNARVLITVPTLDLLDQTSKSLEKTLGEPVGRVSGRGHCWQRVTVAVINSLKAHVKKFSNELESLDVVIVDECHRSSSESYRVVLDACRNACRRIGLSATPYTGTSLDLMMEGILGPMLLEVKEEEVKENGLIVLPRILTIPVKDPKLLYPGGEELTLRRKRQIIYNTHNQKPEQADVYRLALVQNDERNAMALDMIQAFLKSRTQGGALVLVQHVSHGQRLVYLAANRRLSLPWLSGQAPKKERTETLRQFTQGRFPVLAASSILNEGVDIPHLRLLINLGGGASDRAIVQQLGRVVRADKGKSGAILVDFEDKERFYLASNFRSRLKATQERFPNTHESLTLKEVLEILSKPI